MRLTSSDFADQDKIPRVCTCEGEGSSPALAWVEAPKETRSFVLLCNDPDAPAGVWRHWAAYDIPPAVSQLARGAGRAAEHERFKQAINDFGRPGYGGPCPPRGHGPHHYRFCLLALSVDRLEVRKDAHCRDVEREARKHTIAEAVLVGTFER
jgi:Raf kinase inhibitor-like YbhB/YbcL family protein